MSSIGQTRQVDLALPLRQLGLVLVVAYCFFNIVNVLHLHRDVSFIGQALVALGMVFVLQRVVILFKSGLVVTRYEVTLLLLLLLLIAVVFAQRAFLTTYIGSDGVDTLGFIRSVTTVSIVWVLIGGSISMSAMRPSSLLALGLAGSLLLVFLGAVNLSEGAAVSYYTVRTELGLRVSHLTMEKYVIPILALAYAFSSKVRIPVLLISFSVLFLMGGRTALVVFFVSIVLLNLRGSVARNMVVMAFVAATVFLGARYLVDSGVIDTESNAVRDMLFLGGLEDDASYVGRKELLYLGLKGLPNQFFIGDFTLITEQMGGFGGYIHNILSAWQFYGFFVFAAILLSLGTCARRARRVFYASENPSPLVVFGVFMIVYVVLSVVIAKSVLWNMLWFTLGFWLLMPEQRSSSVNMRRRRVAVRKSSGSRNRLRRLSRGVSVK